ncbi:GDSL esterase/lipase At1g29670-like [Abrus precatorius]|uniref:GDSL esterase/lipase At1g29670-like n=1 Tax=Abrus precatorius TaxID=3816 RepID=A0A8B8K321_ABRPR|nr:GDSL esterase/lipase At1g29670-like [Abrus precatorius]
MVAKTKTWLVLSLLLLAANCMQHCVYGDTQLPCLFIFGDSLSDNGNNNNLPTAAKSNYNPYGIDFPKGPTGRFTNGRTSIDIIGQLLGFQNFIPPFANLRGSDILKGVNYASGAAGIRIETGTHLGADISLGSQLANHGVILSKIANKLGGFDKAVKYLNKCLYYVNIGSNDYINNYFRPQIYPTSRIYAPDQYAKILIDQLSLYLQTLHDFGARKYVLVGVGAIGCTPNAMSTHGTNGSCVQEMNAAASIYSNKLKSLVDQFNNKFPADSKSIFIDSTAGSLDSSSLGFTVSNAPCCPTREDGHCAPDQMPCKNRNEYVFWDGFHTTEATNLIVALTSYNASNQAFTHPMDIKHLVQSNFVCSF